MHSTYFEFCGLCWALMCISCAPGRLQRVKQRQKELRVREQGGATPKQHQKSDALESRTSNQPMGVSSRSLLGNLRRSICDTAAWVVTPASLAILSTLQHSTIAFLPVRSIGHRFPAITYFIMLSPEATTKRRWRQSPRARQALVSDVSDNPTKYKPQRVERVPPPPSFIAACL